ncbi:MAG: ABC transporter ATP-binding protein [bacterium]
MAKVTLKNINKFFGEVHAVKNLDLEIQQGEFFSVLGPSGCGKTTTLRMIAGFEMPTSGHIFFDDQDITYIKPNRRNTGMVFQSYALFPHMSVFENIAFGLKVRKLAQSKIKYRVSEVLNLVNLEGYERRRVTELSGGQQQRVALARALVIEPGILLLDEPLSNLDAKLREETRQEIRSLQKSVGITAIYVTHDQDEAMAISDRIAVLKQGVCQQVGTPEEIYSNPKNRFVAKFVGNSNILEATYLKGENSFVIAELMSGLKIHVETNGKQPFSPGQKFFLSIRPENIKLVSLGGNVKNVFEGRVKNVQYSGGIVEYNIDVKSHGFRVKRFVEDGPALINETAFVHIPPSRVNILSQ